MTRDNCASCSRPLAPATGTRIGPVRYCGTTCVREWFSDPNHDRRRAIRKVQLERRFAT